MDGAATLTIVASIIGIVENPRRARSFAVPPRDAGTAADSSVAVRFTVSTLRIGPRRHQEGNHPGTATTTRAAPAAMTIAAIHGMLARWAANGTASWAPSCVRGATR